jgi:hypothetical protein
VRQRQHGQGDQCGDTRHLELLVHPFFPSEYFYRNKNDNDSHSKVNHTLADGRKKARLSLAFQYYETTG